MTNENKKEIYSNNNITENKKQNLFNKNFNLYNKIFKENNKYFKYNNNSFNNYLLTNKEKSFDNNIVQNNLKKGNIIFRNQNINLDYSEDIISNYDRKINQSRPYFTETNIFDGYNRDKTFSKNLNKIDKIKELKKENEKNATIIEENSNKNFTIEYLMELVDYKGKINNFPNYLKELKLKADITTTVQNMIKDKNDNHNEINKYFGIKEKNKEILKKYKFVINRLKPDKDILSTKKEYDKLYNDMYLSRYSSKQNN